jgi:SH3 domain-containing YSC84-like protein 1
MTVFKAGFLGSGRFGSGVVVARLADGTWSAPSAIGTVGGGFGGQIGFELTDFVFILNDAMAVKTFAQVGSLTLGGNVSIAAGPVGRNAEAAGAASLKSVAGIFSYSKTKGLFAGVSLEGSVLIERRDANEKLYNRKLTARELLSGSVPVPAQAEPLMRVLNSRVFAGVGGSFRGDDAMYNDVPVYDDAHEDVVWQGRQGSAYGEGLRTDRTGTGSFAEDSFGKPNRASTWQDDPYDKASNRFSRANPTETFDRLEQNRQRSSTLGDQSDYVYSDRKGSPPGRPAAPKPNFGNKGNAGPGQAIAKFTFDADQPGMSLISPNHMKGKGMLIIESRGPRLQKGRHHHHHQADRERDGLVDWPDRRPGRHLPFELRGSCLRETITFSGALATAGLRASSILSRKEHVD